RRLQLKIELAAIALTQRQAPGAVDAAAKRRMDDELHAAGLVEEALQHHRILRRHAAERRNGGGEILDKLLRGGRLDADDIYQPGQRSLAGWIGAQPRPNVAPQARDRGGQLVGAARRLAQPERDIGRLAMSVLDPHGPAFDPLDAVRRIAELEHVALHALYGEVFVD